MVNYLGHRGVAIHEALKAKTDNWRSKILKKKPRKSPTKSENQISSFIFLTKNFNFSKDISKAPLDYVRSSSAGPGSGLEEAEEAEEYTDWTKEDESSDEEEVVAEEVVAEEGEEGAEEAAE